MGLTIHYKMAGDKNLSAAVVRELAQRTALYARKIGCAEVGEVMRVETDTPFTPRQAVSILLRPALRDYGGHG